MHLAQELRNYATDYRNDEHSQAIVREAIVNQRRFERVDRTIAIEEKYSHLRLRKSRTAKIAH